MPREELLRAGEIWNVNLSPVVGHEQAGQRPAIVISNSHFNILPNGLVIVIPLTTTSRDLPHFYEIRPPEGGLTQISYAICDQPRSVSIERLEFRRGIVHMETLAGIRRLVKLFLDD